MSLRDRFKRPPDLVCPATGYRAWLLDHPAVFCEFADHTRGTDVMARFMIDLCEVHVRAKKYDRPIVLVHDWRKMQGYDTSARRDLTAFVRSRPPMIAHTVIILPERDALSMRAIQMVATILRGLKIPFEVSYEMDAIIKKFA